MVTGTNIYNYFKCKRQLHLTKMNITFSDSSENMQLGKLIELETYKRRNKKFKQYDIGVGIVDFIDFDKKIIYETKKTDSYIELAKWQFKYYLMSLGDDWVGIIEVPKKRKKFDVILTEEDKFKLKEAILYIENININYIPDLLNKSICKKCSFYDYCYV